MQWRRLLMTSSCLVAIAGCGAIYIPQEFEASKLGYGYHRTDNVDIEVLPLTFSTAMKANSDGYSPRGLPDVFDSVDPIQSISTRNRIAQAGLDVVDPALQFEPLPAPTDLNAGTRDVLRPIERRTDRQPGPVLDLNSGTVDTYGRSAAAVPPAAPSISAGDLPQIERPEQRRQIGNNPPPAISPEPYTIGPGDVIGLLSRLQPLATGSGAGGTLADASKRLLVQGDGEIFIPQAGPVDVGGLTLAEARRMIFDRLVDNQLDFDFGVEILEFGSKKIAVNGPSGATLLPVTVRPPTLGEAVVAAGGVGTRPADVAIRVLRDGSIYEISGERLMSSSALSGRYLKAGDAVSVAPAYDVEGTLAYFNQQLRVRELEQAPYDAARANRAEQRAAEVDMRARLQFEIQMETYRLEAERLRQEASIARFEQQRGADIANEEARIKNLEAQQAYLDRLRDLQTQNRAALRAAEAERRSILLSNASERARERSERRALLELELREEAARLERVADQRDQARKLFNERVRLGALQQDYVTIAGELNQQGTYPLPFDGVVTLNRVLYENSRGPNVSTGDSSEIYVIRRAAAGATVERIIAYHLDASNAANLAVATAFEMRPNDVVFVNPQPVTNWNRVLSQLVPSTSFLGSVASTASGIGN